MFDSYDDLGHCKHNLLLEEGGKRSFYILFQGSDLCYFGCNLGIPVLICILESVEDLSSAVEYHCMCQVRSMSLDEHEWCITAFQYHNSVIIFFRKFYRNVIGGGAKTLPQIMFNPELKQLSVDETCES